MLFRSPPPPVPLRPLFFLFSQSAGWGLEWDPARKLELVGVRVCVRRVRMEVSLSLSLSTVSRKSMYTWEKYCISLRINFSQIYFWATLILLLYYYYIWDFFSGFFIFGIRVFLFPYYQICFSVVFVSAMISWLYFSECVCQSDSCYFTFCSPSSYNSSLRFLQHYLFISWQRRPWDASLPIKNRSLEGFHEGLKTLKKRQRTGSPLLPDKNYKLNQF